MAHDWNPKFCDEDFIAECNGKREASHKDTGGQWSEESLQEAVSSVFTNQSKEEFACFATRLNDFLEISSSDERGTMYPIKW